MSSVPCERVTATRAAETSVDSRSSQAPVAVREVIATAATTTPHPMLRRDINTWYLRWCDTVGAAGVQCKEATGADRPQWLPAVALGCGRRLQLEPDLLDPRTEVRALSDKRKEVSICFNILLCMPTSRSKTSHVRGSSTKRRSASSRSELVGGI